MSSYADMWKNQAHFIEHWCPETEGDGLPAATAENLRWHIARARSAEADLAQIKDALRVLKAAL